MKQKNTPTQSNVNPSPQRAVFTTRFGAIAATVGSAVGLGNIWRFPYEAGTHGGGAFIVFYVIALFIICVPVLCAEFCLGKAARSNVFAAFRKLAPKTGLHLFGYLSILAAMLILSFYSVVAGWTLEYCIHSLFGAINSLPQEQLHQQFIEMTTGWRPVLWTVIFLFCNTLILLRGVTKGIERASNIMMPIFAVLLVLFCINSLTLPGATDGLRFIFVPDFSQITPSVMLGALGQAFFSLSLGLGTMMTYASYFKPSTAVGRTAVTTAILDTVVAIIAAIIIFPAVFSFGYSPSAGPTLVFEVLPSIFSNIPLGQLWSTLFFLLLFLASISSTISMSEIPITYFIEEKHLSRRSATLLAGAISLIGGLICALSFGPLKHVTIFSMTFFNLFDYFTSNILLPLGGIIVSIAAGWIIDRKILQKQFAPDHGHSLASRRRFSLLIFFLRWVCPLAIFLIFLRSISVI